MLLICMFNQGHIVQKKFISSVQGFVHTEITQASVHNMYFTILIDFFPPLSVSLGHFLKNKIITLLKMQHRSDSILFRHSGISRD